MEKQNRKGHVTIRPAAGNQFRVYTYGSNGEQLSNTERFTTHDSCLTNILADLDAKNGSHVEVRDFTDDGEKFGIRRDDYTLYYVRADGSRTVENPSIGNAPAPDSQTQNQ